MNTTGLTVLVALIGVLSLVLGSVLWRLQHQAGFGLLIMVVPLADLFGLRLLYPQEMAGGLNFAVFLFYTAMTGVSALVVMFRVLRGDAALKLPGQGRS